MSITFRPAKREAIPLLLGVAGGTGSGKTFSALRLARGIAGGKPFYVIDTENGRAAHYADEFEFQHGELHAPFRPSAYADAIDAAAKQKPPVIVVDSASHEWTGDGGMLDMQEAEMRGEESRRLMSWIKPKMEHKKFVTRLLQLDAHVILCFRAEPKVDMVKGERGWEIVPKASLVGVDGWIPISEKMLPYELTASFLLMADKPGVPKPIKLPGKLAPLVPLDAPLTEDVGARLAEWAAGSSSGGGSSVSSPTSTEELAAELLALADAKGMRDEVAAKIESRRAHDDEATFVQWLLAQIARARATRVPA